MGRHDGEGNRGKALRRLWYLEREWYGDEEVGFEYFLIMQQ
jgi:hypothetical protein